MSNLSDLITEPYYPIAVKILKYLKIHEIVHCFHASNKFENVVIDVLKRRIDDKGWNLVHGIYNEVFLREFHFKLKWRDICRQILSESFIREYSDKVDWKEISWNQYLSENFIIEFQDKVEWNYISTTQTLSENFIRRFKDKVNWDKISSCQELSEDFMREFRSKLNWRAIKHKYKLDLSIEFMFEFQFLLDDDYSIGKRGLKRCIDDVDYDD